jgi:CDP-diacylglycerol--glycerol-3-phosphate 3-phosphatidyltransferase
MSLRHLLADEIANLRAHAIEWRGSERKVRFWTRVIVQIVKGML